MSQTITLDSVVATFAISPNFSCTVTKQKGHSAYHFVVNCWDMRRLFFPEFHLTQLLIEKRSTIPSTTPHNQEEFRQVRVNGSQDSIKPNISFRPQSDWTHHLRSCRHSHVIKAPESLSPAQSSLIPPRVNQTFQCFFNHQPPLRT
jgi:hypothetical protein